MQMLESIIVIAIVIALSNIKVGEKVMYVETRTDFDTLDDYMEYVELKRTGWKGSIDDFYKWRDE